MGWRSVGYCCGCNEDGDSNFLREKQLAGCSVAMAEGIDAQDFEQLSSHAKKLLALLRHAPMCIPAFIGNPLAPLGLEQVHHGYKFRWPLPVHSFGLDHQSLRHAILSNCRCSARGPQPRGKQGEATSRDASATKRAPVPLLAVRAHPLSVEWVIKS